MLSDCHFEKLISHFTCHAFLLVLVPSRLLLVSPQDLKLELHLVVVTPRGNAADLKNWFRSVEQV